MHLPSKPWLRGWRAVFAALGLVVALAIAVPYALAWAGYSAWSAEFAAVRNARETADMDRVATHRPVPFFYRGNTRFVNVTVTAAELRQGEHLATSAIFSAPNPVRARYLQDLVRWQANSTAVDSMASDLRGIAKAQHLDSDAYVDLMATFVQDIPYGEAEYEFMLPAEVAQHGNAVCSDKSVLLAALLVHEGYDAGIWVLDRENHVAAAVRGAGPGFASRTHTPGGYAYIETTRRAYVGEIPSDFGGAAHGGMGVQLVSFGSGKAYTSDPLNEYVLRRMRALRSRARSVDEFDRHAQRAQGIWKRQYAERARELRRASSLCTRLESLSDDSARAYDLVTRSGGR